MVFTYHCPELEDPFCHHEGQHRNRHTREVTGWPAIVNLRADPYEKGPNEADLDTLGWYTDNLWTFVPAQAYIKKFPATIPDDPFQ